MREIGLTENDISDEIGGKRIVEHQDTIVCGIRNEYFARRVQIYSAWCACTGR